MAARARWRSARPLPPPPSSRTTSTISTTLNWPLKQKIEAIATQIYGAGSVYYEPAAEKKLKLYQEKGFGDLRVCMAKTHLSLSHDPKLIGAPQGYQLPIRDVNLSAGAGFIYPLCGEMRTMPGLGRRPAGATSISTPMAT